MMMMRKGIRKAIKADRVVAIIADLDTGLSQIGSGYLLTRDLILTSRHCTLDKITQRPARRIRAVRLSDRAETDVSVIPVPPGTRIGVGDIALLGLDRPWIDGTLELPPFGRVDRSRTCELKDCIAVGFPKWQIAPEDESQEPAEVRGVIRVLDDVLAGTLVMRDPLLNDVTVPPIPGPEEETPWAGLSGAVVFYEGILIGVIIRHYCQQGGSALTIQPVEKFAAALGPLLNLTESIPITTVNRVHSRLCPERKGGADVALF